VKARILGEPILDFHVALVGLSLLDGFLVLWKHRIAWLHVPSVLWSSLVNISSWVCPLTPLENMYRHLAGQAGYEGGFIQHYIAPLVSPCGMPRRQEGADNRLFGSRLECFRLGVGGSQQKHKPAEECRLGRREQSCPPTSPCSSN
jgi:hypothetical protein